MLTWLALTSCSVEPNGLAQIRARGELRVGTVNEPTTYYLGAHGPQGYEYRLARAFADSLNVPLVIVAARDRSTLRELLAEGSVDIAAAQLTADESWKRAGLATSTYREVEQLVVQRRGHAATTKYQRPERGARSGPRKQPTTAIAAPVARQRRQLSDLD